MVSTQMNTLSALTTLFGVYVNLAPPEFHDSLLFSLSFFCLLFADESFFLNDNVTTIKNTISQHFSNSNKVRRHRSAILQLLPQPATHPLSLGRPNIATKLRNFNYHHALIMLDSPSKVHLDSDFER